MAGWYVSGKWDKEAHSMTSIQKSKSFTNHYSWEEKLNKGVQTLKNIKRRKMNYKNMLYQEKKRSEVIIPNFLNNNFS